MIVILNPEPVITSCCISESYTGISPISVMATDSDNMSWADSLLGVPGILVFSEMRNTRTCMIGIVIV